MILPRIFHASISNIHHAAFWLSFFALMSGLLGLFRDRLLAGMFGASRSLDIYYAAFRAPDFLYTLILFFAASTAIIPIILKYAEAGSRVEAHMEKEGEELFGSLLSFFLVVILVLASLAFILMPFLVSILFPGFSSADQADTVLMSRILLFSPLFLGLSNIFSSVSQTFGRFFVYALSPVFYNLGIIFGIFFFYPNFGFRGLAWGVALGALLHMVIQLPAIFSFKAKPRFIRIWHPDLKKIIFLSFPRTLGLATNQVVLVVFTALASTLSHGSIAIFNLAYNLEYLPVTLIGISYSVAAFPTLASLSLKQATDLFKEHFSTAFRHIFFWALPATLLILVLRAQIVRVILGTGNFTWEDTRLTAASLFILSLAVVFQSLFALLTRAFYAEGETFRPFAVNLVSMAISVGAAFWFSAGLSEGGYFMSTLGQLFRVSDIADIRVLALPLGMFLGSAFNFVLLFISFRAVFGWYPSEGAGKSFRDSLFASGAGALTAYWALRILSEVFDLQTFMGIFLQGLIGGLSGIIVVGLVLWVFRSRELIEIYGSIRNKFSKEQITTPEPEKLP